MKRSIDYSMKISGARYVPKKAAQLSESPSGFSFTSSISSVTQEGEVISIVTTYMDNAATFYQNLQYWKKETCVQSTLIFDNDHFNRIVDMGINAVPFIVEELRKSPSHLVHALDLIFPNVVQYEGFVSLKVACDKWLSILE